MAEGTRPANTLEGSHASARGDTRMTRQTILRILDSFFIPPRINKEQACLYQESNNRVDTQKNEYRRNKQISVHVNESIKQRASQAGEREYDLRNCYRTDNSRNF